MFNYFQKLAKTYPKFGGVLLNDASWDTENKVVEVPYSKYIASVLRPGRLPGQKVVVTKPPPATEKPVIPIGGGDSSDGGSSDGGNGGGGRVYVPPTNNNGLYKLNCKLLLSVVIIRWFGGITAQTQCEILLSRIYLLLSFGGILTVKYGIG